MNNAKIARAIAIQLPFLFPGDADKIIIDILDRLLISF